MPNQQNSLPILQLEHISKVYKRPGENLKVLKDVQLNIKPQQSVAIIGHSGSGKSTLLHIAGVLDSPTSGTVKVNGKPVAHITDKAKAQIRNKYFGFVYQYHHLLREFTALENVLMPLTIAGKGDNALHINRARDLLAHVGLEKREKHLPGELSGGEQQRVAIARALIHKPQLLLADEPTGNLDPETAQGVSQMLFDLVKSSHLSVLLVTHNRELAKQCDAQYEMKSGVLSKKLPLIG